MTISMVIPNLMRDPEKIIKNNGFPHSREWQENKYEKN